jgi:DNA (cytosine-5)-methyltransferase 1
LTDRELASLQTFPNDHVFKGNGIRKQIGNAVPPLVGKLIFSCVRKHLEQSDKVEKKRLG